MELDETDDKVLVELMWSTMAYMHARKDDLLALKELILIWVSFSAFYYLIFGTSDMYIPYVMPYSFLLCQ